MTEQAKRQSIVAAGMTVLISFVTFGIVMVLYVTHEVRESQRHQCGVIALSTKPRPIPPVVPFDPTVDPSTEYGKVLDKYIRAKQQYDKELEQFNLRAGKELRTYAEQIGCPLP